MKNRERGITLIETLVALAIMGLVTVAILILVGQNTRFAAAARDRTYASIAVDNLMVETLAKRSRLDTGETLGDAAIAGRNWRYRLTVEETGVDDVFLIDLTVLDQDGGQVLAHASTLRKEN